ncbi:N-acetylmuramoyl-L-alanine amidase [Romboutsia sp. 1001713B170207_170306_H8]|uniref:N-acetylmuramoyl-L-alanine amidase n=1 Tax=Romboutsia sp. 1001713B170207_170306_H8 TaxID=2787112 RepID=UPI0018994E10|nr:N-acetylmuramoyl-L-alanine amidase [Romboutsia sp. 1001713B170207_170306_H8]
MSYKRGRSKNNVTYLHKKNKKSVKNVKRKKNVKKRKVNLKNLSILVVGILILSFGLFKAGQGVTTLVKNIASKTTQTSEAETIELEKQFDMSEEQGLSTKKYTIFIDPGHGGEDNGMQNKETEVYEKDITLAIGKKLASKLSKHTDVDVVMSRSDSSKNLTTTERIEEASKAKADVMISLHMNAEYGGNTASGVEVYYKKDDINKTNELASLIQDSIKSYVEIRDRGVGVGRFDILDESTVSAIMIKCGFITNTEDVKNLTDDKYLDEFTEGIAQGILSYIDANK